MNTTSITRRRPPKRRTAKTGAFTLLEVLLAITVLGMLLASVGVAFKVSMMGYEVNDDFTSATQIARNTLGRMMRDVRMAVDLDSTATRLEIIPPDDGSGLTKIVYELSDATLYYRRTVSGVETSHVLLNQDDTGAVETFQVLREDDLVGEPISVSVRLVIRVGNQPLGVTSSATLRKRQLY